jgi:hypothetical protein
VNAFTPIVPDGEIAEVDYKLAFLARAAARFELVHIGEMDIDEAFDGLVVYLACACDRERIDRWEREFPYPHQATSRSRPTPAVTLDAVIYCVRQRGLAALKESENIERISRMAATERARLDVRIEKVISQTRI